MEKWQLDGRDVSLLIGGPEGLAPECIAASEQKWSLSNLTLPHPLVRIIVAESLYRGWSLNNNHPYEYFILYVGIDLGFNRWVPHYFFMKDKE